MTPNNCLQNILSSRGLEKWDGRPLYNYRIKDNEYQELRQVLLNNRLNHDSYQNWDTCFVLFATEWWKRNYINDFSYDGILNELKLHLDAQGRSELIERGIKRLGRKLYYYNDGSRNLLGTIALEAGIPTKTLERGGWLSKLIKKLYSEYVKISASSASFNDSFSLSAETLNIPQTFRREVFSELLENLIGELVKLKRKYSLEEKSKPIEYLDSIDFDWRNTFPIQIETKEGANFLNDLLTEIASIPEPVKYLISLDRNLYPHENTWVIKAKLNLPSKSVFLENLGITNPSSIIKFESTSKVIVELLSSSGFKRNIGYATIGRRGEDRKIVIELPKPNNFEIPSDSITDKFDLHLISQGEILAVLPAGEELNRNTPWVFVNIEGKYLLKAQSSFKSSVNVLIVLVNKDYQIQNGEAVHIGSYNDWANIYQIDNEAVFIRNDDERFRITAKSIRDDKVKYEIYGMPMPVYLSSNRTRVFIGQPKLFAVDQETFEKKIINPEVRSLSNTTYWSALESKTIGHINLRVRSSEGDNLFTSDVFILPQDFEVKLFGDNKLATSGRIEIRNVKPFDVQVISEEVESTIEPTPDGYEIALRARASTPPQNISLRLFKKGLDDIKLAIPFPSSGVQIFDKDGLAIRRSYDVYLSQLHGIRIRLYNNSNLNEKFTIQLRVIDSGIGETEIRDLYFKQTKEDLGFVTEIALMGLKEEIDKLFAVITKPDKTIKLEILDHHSITKGSIQIKQYSLDFDRLITDDGYLELQTWNQNFDINSFHTFRFDQNNQGSSPKGLKAADTTNENKIRFSCASNFNSEGTWFIYPSQRSSLAFRPFTIIIGDGKNHEDDITCLREAAFIRDQTTRISKLIIYTENLAEDFGHDDWQELKWLWENTNHLAMGFLDIWTAFSKSNLGIASIYFQTDLRTGLLNKLMNEYPILIEVIDLQIWIKCAKTYLNFWTQKTDLITAKILTEKKINDLGENLNLQNLSMFLKREVLEVKDDNSEIKADLVRMLLNSDYEALIKRLNPDTCPQFLIGEISHTFQKLPYWLILLFPKVSFNSYIPIAYLPALLAYKSIYPDGAYPIDLKPVQLYKMRKLIEVDQVWFHSTYDMIQGFCLNMKSSIQ